MNEPEVDWSEMKEQIATLIERYSQSLDKDSKEAVQHYIDHDEYEMAFEGLCLELLTLEGRDVDWGICLKIARKLGLDRESVFDHEFWVKISRKAGSV